MLFCLAKNRPLVCKTVNAIKDISGCFAINVIIKIIMLQQIIKNAKNALHPPFCIFQSYFGFL